MTEKCLNIPCSVYYSSHSGFEFNQTLSASTNENAATGHVTFEDSISGGLTFSMSMNYYNRLLSGWEPMVEPWLLKVTWTGNPASDNDLNVKVTGKLSCPLLMSVIYCSLLLTAADKSNYSRDSSIQ